MPKKDTYRRFEIHSSLFSVHPLSALCQFQPPPHHIHIAYITPTPYTHTHIRTHHHHHRRRRRCRRAARLTSPQKSPRSAAYYLGGVPCGTQLTTPGAGPRLLSSGRGYRTESRAAETPRPCRRDSVAARLLSRRVSIAGTPHPPPHPPPLTLTTPASAHLSAPVGRSPRLMAAMVSAGSGSE